MSADPKHILWDTCVLWRLFSKNQMEYQDHVKRYVLDAERGERTIYTSSVALAEIDQRAIDPAVGTPDEFFQDLKQSIRIIDATPNIMIMAGALRSNSFVYSQNDKDGSPPKPRSMGVGDSIFHATGIWLRESAGIDDLVFHTFDAGASKGWEGKCAPILKLEHWCKGIDHTPLIAKALATPRKKAVHPLCPLPKTTS